MNRRQVMQSARTAAPLIPAASGQEVEKRTAGLAALTVEYVQVIAPDRLHPSPRGSDPRHHAPSQAGRDVRVVWSEDGVAAKYPLGEMRGGGGYKTGSTPDGTVIQP